jgi:NDP-sugar pyrophosphorylase family protein
MAGGLGSRLGELTASRPKPLLPVGEKPLLETILTEIARHGFESFYISVNYKADMILRHFGDGSKWGVQIKYLHEENRMGTAGALSLLSSKPKDPLLVVNGDVLTSVNFDRLLNFHHEHSATATMCIRQYDFQVPYGVVSVNNHTITRIDEKPLQHFFINAGIYMLNPEAIDLIPKNTAFDMPQVFDRVIEEKKTAIAFPIREYWLDIGHRSDFERANEEFFGNFSN